MKQLTFIENGTPSSGHNLTVSQPFIANEGTFSHHFYTRNSKIQSVFTKSVSKSCYYGVEIWCLP